MRPRAREVDPDSRLATLANSLTLAQLRTTIAALAGQKKISLTRHEDVFDALSATGRDVETICKALLDTEASTPFKHFFVAAYTGSVEALDDLPQLIQTRDFRFEKTRSAKEASYLSVTLEHSVPTKIWRTADGNADFRTAFYSSVRHPIVIRFYTDFRIVSISYPGFSQGDLPRKERLDYYDIVDQLLDSLKSTCRTKVSPLPLEHALNLLQKGENRRVRIVRSDLEYSSGRMNIVSQQKESSVEDLLSRQLGKHLGATIDSKKLREAISATLADATANSIVIYWLREEVVTRVKFWPIGAELFFVWNETGNTYYLIDEIFRVLSNLSVGVEGNSATVWQWLSGLEPGGLAMPGNVCAKFAIDSKLASQTLMNAMNAGILEPVYRLRSAALLQDIPNDWTVDLKSLNRDFVTESGEKIVGSDPRNIEVAFRRVSEGANK